MAKGKEWLQCGHDPKAVENDGPQNASAKSFVLQCGHDPKAVENAMGAFVPPRGRELQCGHDPKAVENRRRTGSYCVGP